MKVKRIQWKEYQKTLPTENLIFLDESGVNIGMVRHYGRGMGGLRVVDRPPLNKPKGTTLISAIRSDGVFAQTSYLGGTTKERFLQYVRETLVPALKPGEIVVIDNLTAHHTPELLC